MADEAPRSGTQRDEAPVSQTQSDKLLDHRHTEMELLDHRRRDWAAASQTQTLDSRVNDREMIHWIRYTER